MKTLKKTLSLTLVFALVFSLMSMAFAAETTTTSTSATGFTDEASIQYKEAVDVMTGIGAINGMGDGTFAPKSSLTRAQAAKMVAYTVLGQSVASTLPVKVSSYKDVTTANFAWAIPSIEYLTGKGIVAGYGDGNFGPNDKVTANQLAKMLLVAVGYGKNGEYTGSGWELNAAVDASKLKLYAGTKATSYSAPATREEAALYCFNTLTTVPQVNWSKDKEAYEHVKDDKTIGTSVYGLAKSKDQKVDNFGRPAAVWTVTGETDPIAQTAATPAATFTDASYVKDFASYSFADDVQILVNGETTTLATVNELKSRAYNGVGIELYNTDTDKDIETIALTQGYLAKVTDYTATKGATAGNFKLEIYNPWGTTGNKTVTDNLKSTSDLFDKLLAADYAKNDYLIVYTKAADVTGDPTILKFEAVKTVTGALSTYSATDNDDGFNGSVTVGGTKYTLASGAVDNKVAGFLSNDGSTQTLAAQLGKNVTVFIDSYGMVVGVTAEQVATTTELYYFVDAYNTTVYDNYGNPAKLVKAQAVDMTGKEVSFLIGVEADANETAVKDKANTDFKGKLCTAVTAYDSTLKADKTTLTASTLNTSTEKVGTVKTELTTATAKLEDGAYLSSDTVFLYVTGTGTSLKVTKATGAQTADSAAITYYGTKTATVGNYTVKYVVVAGSPSATQATSLMFVPQAFNTNTAVPYTKADGTSGIAYKNVAFIDGTPKTDVLVASAGQAPGFYTYSVDSTTGLYTLTPATSGFGGGKVTNVYGDLVSFTGSYTGSNASTADVNAKGAFLVDVPYLADMLTTGGANGLSQATKLTDLLGSDSNAEIDFSYKTTTSGIQITGIYVTAQAK